MNKLIITLKNVDSNILIPTTHNNSPSVMPSEVTSNTPPWKNPKLKSTKTPTLNLGLKETNKANVVLRQEACHFKLLINLMKSPNVPRSKINHCLGWGQPPALLFRSTAPPDHQDLVLKVD